MSRPQITVETIVAAPMEVVWKAWTTPADIRQWNNASPDWHTPTATNDLRVGGKFTYHMAARDGSVGFDFGGTYTEVEVHKLIRYVMDDGREAVVTFSTQGQGTQVVETFEAESMNSLELQQSGWQAILTNFKKYVESV